MPSSQTKYDMIAFTAPSGAGKTTIVRHLIEKFNASLGFSISATTRSKRSYEIEGKDYYFMDNESFLEKVDEGAFIEWEEVYPKKYYGTLHSEVTRIIDSGKKIIFDIEVNGAENLKQKYDERCLVVFVKPPSFRILIQRLLNRKTETPNSFEKRVNRIKRELLFENSFDLVLLNDKLEDTLVNAEEIIKKHLL